MVSGVGKHLENRLAAAAQAVRERARAAARAEELRKLAEEVAGEVAAARARVAEEDRSLARLERLTLTRVVATLRGSRESRLALRRAEADAARLHLAKVEAELAAIRRDQEAIEVRLRELDRAPADYAAVLTEKEQQIRASGGAGAARLRELAEERAAVTEELREIEQADQAALAADQALARVREAVSSAKKWSAYDTYFAGGVFSGMIKHKRLDRAADAAAEADRCLARLHAELADLGDPPAVAPHLVWDQKQKLIDIWVDRVMDDWAVHDQIKRARQRVAEVAAEVERVRADLRQRTEAARQRLDRLEAERRDLLDVTRPPTSG